MLILFMDKNDDKVEEVVTTKGDATTTDRSEKDNNKLQPKTVVYCEVCTFPVEYCEYSHGDKKLTSSTTTVSSTTTTPGTTEAKEGEEAKTEEAGGESSKKKSEKQHIIKVTNHKRSKRKANTTVQNAEKFGINLKDLSKLFSKKFACSSSVVKENNQDIISLTGDIGYDLIDFMIEKFPNLKQGHFKFVENIHKD